MNENRKKMKPKAKIKLAVDLLMTVVLLFLMGYQLWGEDKAMKGALGNRC